MNITKKDILVYKWHELSLLVQQPCGYVAPATAEAQVWKIDEN
jgi:hypothetical protein